MKLATFSQNGVTCIGLAMDDRMINLSIADPDLPTDMIALLEVGDGVKKALG